MTDLVGKYAECRYANGQGIHATGRVVGYSIGPVYYLEAANGERFDWREELVREIPEPTREDAALTEREAVAKWLDEWDTCNPPCREQKTARKLAQAIRAGEHHKEGQ